MKPSTIRRASLTLLLAACAASLTGCSYWEVGFGDWGGHHHHGGHHDYSWGGHHGGHGGGHGGGHCR